MKRSGGRPSAGTAVFSRREVGPGQTVPVVSVQGGPSPERGAGVQARPRRRRSRAASIGEVEQTAERSRGRDSTMSCLVPPGKRVWRGLRARLGLRPTTGLGNLRKQVRTCEYSDIHVMWQMLGKTSTSSSSSGAGNRRRDTGRKGAVATRRARAGRKGAAVSVAWRRMASYCCAL